MPRCKAEYYPSVRFPGVPFEAILPIAEMSRSAPRIPRKIVNAIVYCFRVLFFQLHIIFEMAATTNKYIAQRLLEKSRSCVCSSFFMQMGKSPMAMKMFISTSSVVLIIV